MKKKDILTLLKNQIKSIMHTDYGETYAEAERDDLHEVVTEITAMAGGTLLSIAAADERKLPESECFKIYYAFRVAADSASSNEKKEVLVIVIRVFDDDPIFPSITGICVAANWYEREIFDMFGLYPEHHLDMRRLCHHKHFPTDVFPLRKDFAASSELFPSSDITEARKVQGIGPYELPVGPIHAGIIEPGHFRFSCYGEHIINLDAQLFYTHRGIEKMCEGLDHFKANFLAERICGVCSMAHSVAYSNAVEKIAGTSVPVRARTIRVILLELERMIGHITDIMGIAVDVAFYAASSFAAKLREDLMNEVYEVIRSRYFHSVNMPGGLRRDISDAGVKKLSEMARRVCRDLDILEDLLYSSTSFLERVETTGRLFTETVMEIGVVGIGARASNVKCDARKAFGYEIYDNLDFSEITHATQDVAARMAVRLGEIRQSAKIIEQALSQLKSGPVSSVIGKLPPYKPAFGIVEAPKGEHAHFLMFDDSNRIQRYRVRSASYANWLALTFAIKGNIVPDFPVINKSFNLCYSSCDR
ncbi:MAG TPA: NADH-quinone oxidoreductase subunit C [Candidatus Wallbacteria bacterium]|nr:NADH-quinone oxidoreductase subunit C [Candidatus Wallbacteria bacterium]